MTARGFCGNFRKAPVNGKRINAQRGRGSGLVFKTKPAPFPGAGSLRLGRRRLFFRCDERIHGLPQAGAGLAFRP